MIGKEIVVPIANTELYCCALWVDLGTHLREKYSVNLLCIMPQKAQIHT